MTPESAAGSPANQNEPTPRSPMILEKPLIVAFEHDGEVIFHIWPREKDTYEGYGLLVYDLVRMIAHSFHVDEDAVWKWVEKERRHHTTEIRSPQ